jgi:GldM C-terminal domain
MKNLILSFLFLIFCCCANAQNVFITYKNTEEALVHGLSTRVKIVSTADSITVLNGNLHHSIDSTYYITPDTAGVCILTFWKDGNVQYEEKFRVNNLPLPVVNFSGYRSGNRVPVAYIKAVPGLSSEYPYIAELSCTDGINPKIESFDMSTYTTEGKINIPNSGPAFNKEIKEILQKAKPGQIFIFNNITANTHTGRRTLDGIFIEAR